MTLFSPARKERNMKRSIFKKIGLQFFGAGDNVNATVGYVNAGTGSVTVPDAATVDGYTFQGMSAEMKRFYAARLIDFAKPKLVHEQFGQKVSLPKGNGKTVTFRRTDPLPKNTTALVEGVTPTGKSMKVGQMTATVHQFGDYVEITDLLILTAMDPQILQATELIGDQAGRSCDTIVREALNAGTNVMYGDGTKAARYLITSSDKMSVDVIRRGVRIQKNNLAPQIDSYYTAIIHEDVAYDLQSDSAWVDPHKYVDTEHLYSGEIGRIAGVRFVVSTEAKIFHADALIIGGLSVKTAIESSTTTVAVNEAISSAQATALAGRKCIIGTNLCTIASASANSAGSATLTLAAAITAAAKDAVIYPGEAGAAGRDIYSTLLIGKDAYGVTELEGGGLQHIVKALGSAGASDPLNQRATVGWKRTMAVAILTQTFMLRIETASTFESGAN